MEASPVTLDKLKMFLAVFHTQNITKAAQHLGVSQAAVSVQLRSLETALGLKLFERGRGGARPLAAALKLAPNVRQLLEAEESLFQTASELAGELSGTLRVASFQSVSRGFYPAIHARMKQCYPGVTLLLNETSTSATDMNEALYKGEVDVAFVNHAIDKDLRSWHLFSDPFKLVVPKLWNKVDFPDQFRDEALIGYQDSEDGCSLGLEYLEKTAGFVPRYRFKETTTILSMVSQGLGFTVLPALALEPLPNNVLAVTANLPLSREVHVCVRPHGMRLPVVRAFVDTLMTIFPEMT